MKKVVVIDNYDSFTYNLVHYLEALDCEVTVYRNDEFELGDIAAFHKILLSPGPGIPDEAGLLKQLISEYAKKKSILGVCLGQQAIAEVFGGVLVNLEKVYHGVATEIAITDAGEALYEGLPQTIIVGRYHSWSVNPELPDSLIATAVDPKGEIMSLRHATFDVRGVQFHPESVLTPHGKAILANWLRS